MKKWENILKDMLYLAKQLQIRSNTNCVNPIEYNGVDVNSAISATFPTIKQRFTEEWLRYFEERQDNDALSMFIQAVYHLGYSHGANDSQEEMKEQIELLKVLIKMKSNKEK